MLRRHLILAHTVFVALVATPLFARTIGCDVQLASPEQVRLGTKQEVYDQAGNYLGYVLRDTSGQWSVWVVDHGMLNQYFVNQEDAVGAICKSEP